MVSREGFQEVVVLFDAAGSKIDLEMRLGQFNSLLAQKGTLGSHAASTVKAAYAQVGAGLSVRAVVFFLFKVNEHGHVDPAFNLPLDYMAQNAGEGPDLGNGIISMACRSQCPVPWHAINMWEPAGEGRKHPAMLVQKAVWRNRLGLKAVPLTRRSGDVSSLSEGVRQEVRQVEAHARPVSQAVNGSSGGLGHGASRATNGVSTGSAEPLPRLPRALRQGLARSGSGGSSGGSRADAGDPPADAASDSSHAAPPGKARVQAMEDKLTATFGEAGRVSTAQLPHQQREQMAAQFRDEMARQQQGYLDQIRSCREEIQQLKAALRLEQQRNRRLQQLLRGDV